MKEVGFPLRNRIDFPEWPREIPQPDTFPHPQIAPPEIPEHGEEPKESPGRGFSCYNYFGGTFI